MIKVGITGADSRQAGELLRLLVNHPDVDILAAAATGQAGRSVVSFHHGLIGESDITFTGSLDPTCLDAVFMAPGSDPSLAEKLSQYENLRIIDFSQRHDIDPEMVPAISELFRKPMVRGARKAQVLHPVTSLLMVALYPLAANLLLNGDMEVDIFGPESIIAGESLCVASEQSAAILKSIQASFDGNISFTTSCSRRNRSTRLKTTIPCTLSLDEVDKLYDNIYDDHNFTFITHSPVSAQEVSGTHKCIVTLEKEDSDTLSVTVLGDCRLRGGAGDALHAFNLLFGLHERTGLALKASKF